MTKPTSQHALSISGFDFVVAINDPADRDQVYMTCIGWEHRRELNKENERAMDDWFVSVVDPYRTGDNMIMFRFHNGTAISLGTPDKSVCTVVPAPLNEDEDLVNGVMLSVIERWKEKQNKENL
jgi:hypothetical protein